MNLLLSAATIIAKIIEKDISLAKSAKEYFALHYCTREDRKVVKAIVVATLKHRYVLGRIVLDTFPSIKMYDKRIITIGLANVIYVKGISDEDTLDQIMNLISGDNISNGLLEKLLHQNFNQNDLVPAYVIRNSKEYLHLKYNVPIWLVEMWDKHYGKNILPRLVQSTSKRHIVTLRVNKRVISRRELLGKYPGLYENGASETTVNYLGTRSLSTLDTIKRGELIPISEAVNHFVNKLDFKGRDDVLVMADKHNSIVLALQEKLLDVNNILYALSSYEEVVEARRALDNVKFEGINIVESPLSLLVTYVSKKQDLIIVLPPSSEFQKITANPDFFDHFHNQKIDGILKSQADYLEECSLYVEDDGKLVYLVETGNNKEGTLQIKNFLETHSDFVLVEERQMLPLDKRGCFCYYAILQKGGRK